MNAFDVDYWIGVMCKYSWTPRTLNEKSRHALMYLFHLTDQIAPVGRDNRREFWITAKRGSIEDFQPYYDEDATEEELAEEELDEEVELSSGTGFWPLLPTVSSTVWASTPGLSLP